MTSAFRYIGIRAFIEPSQLGYLQEAVLNLRVNIGHVETVATTLENLPEVSYVAITSGAYDSICTVMLPEISDLLRFTTDKVAKIDGVLSTNTALSLKVVKRASEWLPVPYEPMT